MSDEETPISASLIILLASEGVSSVRVGRHIVVDTDAPSEDAAIASVTAMCERLLANPVIEDFEIESATAS